MDQAAAVPPHVLIFPFPAQGHVNSMLKLAELLCLAGLHVSYLVTFQTRDRLLRHTNIQSRFSSYPGFRLENLPESLSEGQFHVKGGLSKFYDSLRTIAKPFFRELVALDRPSGDPGSLPVSCIIADGILSLTLEVAEETRVPIVYFRTISACAFWTYFCIPELIEAGELPFNGNDMDVLITKVPGMESFLRRRDLPSSCRADDLCDSDFQLLASETRQTPRAQAFILNTFDDLEGPVLSYIRTRITPNVYTIGPLNLHLKTRLAATSPSNSSNSLWEEDRSCIRWLDQQPPKSVVYVSFGSIAITTRDQLMEFWYGLVNSGKRFLWVVRPDSVICKDGENQIPADVSEGTKERGFIVGWAPQEEILAHPAVGGFLTHSGWNSTLESIVEGVPMICWPCLADQQVNSIFVGKIWKLGLDMKDTCDRVIIEKMIRDLMEVRRVEFKRSADQMANFAKKSVSEGGPSYCNLELLVEDIKLISARPPRS